MRRRHNNVVALKGLKRLLIKVKISSITSSHKENRVFKCNRPNCSLRQHLLERNYFDFNRKIFYVNAKMSCDVKHVLYVIKCLGCNRRAVPTIYCACLSGRFINFCVCAFLFVSPALAGRYRRAVIRPFVHSSTIYSGYLVSTTPPTVFGQSF